jgi:hypothetical protein
MNTKYINFVGGPSVGKSLMSALTYVELKALGYSCEMVQEHVKMLIYRENFDMLNCQWLVSYEQYKMLQALQGKVDFVCADSPLLIGLFYNRYHVPNVCDIEKTEACIRQNMEKLQPCVNIFLERNENHAFEESGRIHGLEESKQIDGYLKDLLDGLHLPYLSVKSDRASMPKILDYVVNN